MLLPVETFVEPASGSTLPVLDQPLGVTGELDGGQTEENESPLRRDREYARYPPPEDPADHLAPEDQRIEKREGSPGICGTFDGPGAQGDHQN